MSKGAERALDGAPPGGFAALLGLTTGIQAQATLVVLTLATVAPAAAAQLGVAPRLVGYQVSLIYLAAALMSCLAGTVVRRFGAGWVSQAALLFGIAGCLGLASGSLAVAALASLAIGVGYGLTNPAASQLLHRFTPEHRRNVVFSMKQSGVPLGGLVAGLMLPTLTERFGWQVAVLGTVACGTVLLGLLQPVRRRWDEGREPGLRLRGSLLTGPALVWRHPRLRGLAVMGFCFSATQLSLMTFVVTVLVEDLGWDLVTAGVMTAIMQATGAAARVVWGALADRLGSGYRVLLGLGASSTAFAALTALCTPQWSVVAVAAVLIGFGACSIGWNGVFLAQVARTSSPGAVGTATGGAMMVTFLGVVVGPSLFSLMHGMVGSYAGTFAPMAVFPALGTLALWRAVRHDEG